MRPRRWRLSLLHGMALVYILDSAVFSCLGVIILGSEEDRIVLSKLSSTAIRVPARWHSGNLEFTFLQRQ